MFAGDSRGSGTEGRRPILLERSKSSEGGRTSRRERWWLNTVFDDVLISNSLPERNQRRFIEVWESRPAANGRTEDWSTVAEDVVI